MLAHIFSPHMISFRVCGDELPKIRLLKLQTSYTSEIIYQRPSHDSVLFLFVGVLFQVFLSVCVLMISSIMLSFIAYTENWCIAKIVESWRLIGSMIFFRVASKASPFISSIHPLTVISICSYKCFRLVFNDLYGGKDTFFYVRFITHIQYEILR